MRTKHSCATAAARLLRPALLLAALSAASGMVGQGTAAPLLDPMAATPANESEARPAEALSFADAVDQLTIALFTHAKFDPADAAGRTLVIDPLIDHTSGNQLAATHAMEPRMVHMVNERFGDIKTQPFNLEGPADQPLIQGALTEAPLTLAVAKQAMEPHMVRLVGERFGAIKVQPFNAESLAGQPLILMGSIAPVSAPGIHPFTTAPTQTYRMWAVLADLRTRRIISHESVWVRADQVDLTPTPFFRDSPAWLVDHSQDAYLKTCAGHPGDAMDPAYVEGLPAAATIAGGIKAYEDGHYGEALAAYVLARTQPTGRQLRVYNGLYLANAALKRNLAAEQAFGDVVDYGLQHGKLVVKFLFRPSSTQFWPDRAVSGFYPMWLRQIAARTAAQPACVRLVGHSSATGSAPRNMALSAARASRVRGDLISRVPALSRQTDAVGRGSTELLVGSGRDDATDVLDRRVEFETRSCPQVNADAQKPM